ncbi:unnamed protein product [Diamesa serratosioi]
MKLFTFIVFCFIGDSFCWNDYKLTFEHSDLEFDGELIDMGLTITKKNEKSVINFQSELFDNMEDNIVMHVAHYEKEKGEYQLLLNSTLEVCTLLSKTKTHPIIRLIMRELLKSSNFPTACPVKKGRYYMKDFILNESLMPPFLPEGIFKCYIQLNRVVDGEELMLAKTTIYTHIEYMKTKNLLNTN